MDGRSHAASRRNVSGSSNMIASADNIDKKTGMHEKGVAGGQKNSVEYNEQVIGVVGGSSCQCDIRLFLGPSFGTTSIFGVGPAKPPILSGQKLRF